MKKFGETVSVSDMESYTPLVDEIHCQLMYLDFANYRKIFDRE